MKSPEPDDRRPIRRLLRRLIKAPAAISILWPALLILGGYFAWHRWGAEHVASKYYSVDPSQIEVTPPPAFVRSDVVETVYRDTAMAGLSLLDPQATAKIAAAFATHPWVRRVVSVRKLPLGRIDVNIDYREPVAMVHVISQHPEVSGSSFFVVDSDAVLLPTTDFARAETNQYLHIDVPGAYPTVGVGSVFDDCRVVAAAKLAGVLAEYHDAAKVTSIGVSGDTRQTAVPQLELTTGDNARLFWGSPPGMELPGEATAPMKLRALLKGGNKNADLRMAIRPDEASETPQR